MKRKGYAFAALSALALVLLALASVLLRLELDKYTLTGEVLAGERAAASGFGVKLSATMRAHIAWELDYSAANGECETRSGWELDRTHPADLEQSSETWRDDDPLTASGELVEYIEWDSAAAFEAEFDGKPEMRALAEELRARLSGAEPLVRVSFPLSDYYDFVPLNFDAGELAVSGGVSAAEVFRVPAPEDARLGAYVHHTGMYKFGTYIKGISVRSESVLGSDGYLYFVPDVSDRLGKPLSGELLPGGDWGVYRIPCDGESIDFSRAENIFPLPEGWETAGLELSADGGTLFVLIDMKGGLDMALLDLDTLSVTQTMRVLPASEMAAGFDKVQRDVSSDGIAFAWRNYAAGCSFDGERCEEVYSGSTRFEGLPERFADARFHGQGDVMDIACSGGRLAVLRRINVSPDEMPNSDYLERPYLLLIYGEDGLECADWLSTQLDSFWRINETACITEVEA